MKMSKTLLKRRYFISRTWLSGYLNDKCLENMTLPERDAIMEKGEKLGEQYADLVINQEDFKNE